MAILTLTRAWTRLEEQTTIHVILPNEIQSDRKLQVLWLLQAWAIMAVGLFVKLIWKY